jgi:hypothetical protein
MKWWHFSGSLPLLSRLKNKSRLKKHTGSADRDSGRMMDDGWIAGSLLFKKYDVQRFNQTALSLR